MTTKRVYYVMLGLVFILGHDTFRRQLETRVLSDLFLGLL